MVFVGCQQFEICLRCWNDRGRNYSVLANVVSAGIRDNIIIIPTRPGLNWWETKSKHSVLTAKLWCKTSHIVCRASTCRLSLCRSRKTLPWRNGVHLADRVVVSQGRSDTHQLHAGLLCYFVQLPASFPIFLSLFFFFLFYHEFVFLSDHAVFSRLADDIGCAC